MLHESEKTNNLSVTVSGISFEEVYKKPYVTDVIREGIISANTLLLPYESFREGQYLLFPEYTDDFYTFLKDNSPQDLNIDIAVSDDEYKPIEMHSEMLNLPLMLVELVALPFLINVISNYLYDFIKRRKNYKNQHKAKIEIVVEETKSKKTKTIKYEGDADKFTDAIKDVAESLFK